MRATERLTALLSSKSEEFTDEILQVALQLTGATSAAIAMCEQDEERHVLLWRAFAGRLADEASRIVATESTACSTVLKTKGVQLFIYPARVYSELALKPEIVEALACPVQLADEAVGTLWVCSHDEATQFDQDDAARLERLCRFAAIARRLESHALEADRTRRLNERRLALLWHAAEVLLTAEDPDQMLKRLFENIRDDLAVDTYFNFMVNESGTALQLASCAGIPDEEVQKIQHLDFGQAICGTVAVDRVSIVATDIQRSADPKVQLVKGYGIRAYACNPLMSGDRLLGTLSFASHSRNTFEPQDLDFFRMLSRYVAAAYERLQLIERLRTADRRKDEFLATLAHELRNPLAPIRSSVDFFKHRSMDADLQRARAIIERQVGNMVRLVDDLLDVSRVTQGRITLQKAPTTLALVIEQALESARPLIDAAGHTVHLELPAGSVPLYADATRLSQVFLNLLNNASKYTPNGGQIWIRAARDGEMVHVTVADTGVGIPRDMLPHVFDLFTQVARSLDRSRGGLGIGLTLVKKLVELHGGSVRARSAGENQGTEFIVNLPMANTGASE